MTDWLRQSTAVTIKMGPFLDEDDGKTAETGLTIAQSDIRVSKNGGNYAQSNNVAGATHDEFGEYGIPLDTTDTNTLGRLKVKIHESGALPVWRTFMVAPQQVWDSLFAADRLQVHVAEMTAGIVTSAVIGIGAIDADAIAANAIGASEIAADAIGSSELASSAAVEIADTLLKRDWTSVTGEASRSVLNALRFLRNKWTLTVGGALTVTKEDDIVTAWSGSATRATADAVTGIDPA